MTFITTMQFPDFLGYFRIGLCEILRSKKIASLCDGSAHLITIVPTINIII